MRGGRQKQGYTIVEVMVFLVISGLMFIIAASFINGKQARAEFRQGMNDVNAQIQQTINDVSNGFYPSRGGFTCTAGIAGGVPGFGPATPAAPGVQGTNIGCTFIGKVMQFNISGAASPRVYNTYSVVGRQFKPSTEAAAAFTPPTNFAEAQPTVATGSGNLTRINNLRGGLRLDRMTDNGGNIGAFGIFAGFAGIEGDSGLVSGAATPQAFAIPGTRINTTTAALAQTRVQALATASINSDPSIVMCFSGAARQYGRLTIGTSNGVQNQKLVTHVQITSGAPTVGCPA